MLSNQVPAPSSASQDVRAAHFAPAPIADGLQIALRVAACGVMGIDELAQLSCVSRALRDECSSPSVRGQACLLTLAGPRGQPSRETAANKALELLPKLALTDTEREGLEAFAGGLRPSTSGGQAALAEGTAALPASIATLQERALGPHERVAKKATDQLRSHLDHSPWHSPTHAHVTEALAKVAKGAASAPCRGSAAEALGNEPDPSCLRFFGPDLGAKTDYGLTFAVLLEQFPCDPTVRAALEAVTPRAGWLAASSPLYILATDFPDALNVGMLPWLENLGAAQPFGWEPSYSEVFADVATDGNLGMPERTPEQQAFAQRMVWTGERGIEEDEKKPRLPVHWAAQRCIYALFGLEPDSAACRAAAERLTATGDEEARAAAAAVMAFVGRPHVELAEAASLGDVQAGQVLLDRATYNARQARTAQVRGAPPGRPTGDALTYQVRRDDDLQAQASNYFAVCPTWLAVAKLHEFGPRLPFSVLVHHYAHAAGANDASGSEDLYSVIFHQTDSLDSQDGKCNALLRVIALGHRGIEVVDLACDPESELDSVDHACVQLEALCVRPQTRAAALKAMVAVLELLPDQGPSTPPYSRALACLSRWPRAGLVEPLTAHLRSRRAAETDAKTAFSLLEAIWLQAPESPAVPDALQSLAAGAQDDDIRREAFETLTALGLR